MTLKNLCSIGVVGVMLLAVSSAAMAATGTTDASSSTTYTYTSANSFDGDTVGLTIDSGATTVVNGSTFDNDTTAIETEANGEVTITGAIFNTDSSIISSSGTTILNSATFSNNSGDLIETFGGTTSVYGATFSTTSPNNFREFAAYGGVIDVYGNFGALTGTQLTGTGTVSGILQNDGTTSYTFEYQTDDGGVINLLPDPVTATPEPSALTAFAIAGIALAAFAGLRQRVRA